MTINIGRWPPLVWQLRYFGLFVLSRYSIVENWFVWQWVVNLWAGYILFRSCCGMIGFWLQGSLKQKIVPPVDWSIFLYNWFDIKQYVVNSYWYYYSIVLSVLMFQFWKICGLYKNSLIFFSLYLHVFWRIK